MTWLDLLVLALATYAVLDILFTSKLLASKRASLEAWAEDVDEAYQNYRSVYQVPPRWLQREWFFSHLLTCRQCTAVWVVGLLLLCFFLPAAFLADWRSAILLPVQALGGLGIVYLLENLLE